MIEKIKGHSEIKAQIHQALKQNRLAQALLFSGPSGVGKRLMAWATAQSLLCEKPDGPCGVCRQCLSSKKQQNENVLCVTHKTLQIRLQDVQAIPAFLSLQSFAKAKIALIDSAEKLNPQASHFLLKIIEEPPPKSFFFLISSEPSKLLLTLRSRLQNLRFLPLPEDVIAEFCPKSQPQWMIRASRGRLDVLEELSHQNEIRERAFQLLSELLNSSFSALAMDFPIKIENRKEALILCRFWLEILRDARILKSAGSRWTIHGDGDKKQEIERLSRFPKQVLDIWIKKVLEMEKDLQANADYALCFENSTIAIKNIISPA